MPKVGQSTVYGTIVPKLSTLKQKIYWKKLSRDAKVRLTMIDFYYDPTRGRQNAALTARHFARPRSWVNKWLKRFNPKDLGSLENKSRRPHKVRQATYDYKLILLIKEYREDKNTYCYSEKKLASIFWSEYTDDWCHVSPATIGRIIKKFNYFFYPYVTLKTRSKQVKKIWSELKKRRPAGLKATAPRQIIEFDMKHFNTTDGTKYYLMCSIDQFSKDAVIHVASSCSSVQGKIAIEKAIKVYGKKVSVLNDNGSENLGKMWDYLEENEVMQYFAHPYSPKEKGVIERFIGTLDRECLAIHRNDIHSIEDLEYYVQKWLNNYNFSRPHMSLKCEEHKYILYTPAEFCATMGITIHLKKVSTM